MTDNNTADLRCRQCGGTEDLMDRAMMPGATYCAPCRKAMSEQAIARQEARNEMAEGLLHKYDVERVSDPDGKHTGCRYFVLDPQHDPLAREALGAYANAAAVAGYTTLATDLNRWLSDVT